MRILVSGAKWTMGHDLCYELRAEGRAVSGVDLPEFDVRVSEQTHEVVVKTRPQLVFHLAVLTDVDGCEQHPDEAYSANAIGTQVVALEYAAADIPMVCISTLGVLDGLKPEPYSESDVPYPASVYSC